jgi:hypothetical protein
LPLIDKAADITHLRKYEGKRIGVDAATWLHKGESTIWRGGGLKTFGGNRKMVPMSLCPAGLQMSPK